MVQWAEEEVERELAEMTEREGGGGGEGGGEWVFGSWFIEGARAFKHKKCRRGRYLLQLQRMLAKRTRAAVLQSWWKGWRCVVGG